MNSSDINFDIIFAGGGTAACLTAGRLAAADPNLKILILEAGEHTKDMPAHIQPARYFSHLASTSKTVTFNVGKASDKIGGRSLITPSGRCVGGGSSVNFTMYTRGSASDYDDWETVHENPGWGSKDLLPLMKKTETYQIKPGEATHGYSGPLKVSWGGAFTNVGQQFLDVAQAIDKDRGPTHDVNGLFNCNGYGRWQKYIWIDADTGRRSDVPHHFIYTQSHNKNLVILTGQKVKRVIFEGNKAIGLEYVGDTVQRPDADQTIKSVYASKLVVIAGGAFGSPTILERSGIGRKDILEQNGVSVKVDLPGVGESYQDHAACFVPYQASDDAETLDALFRGEEAEIEKWLEMWPKGKGLMAHNGVDAGIKMRPTEEDLKELGPEFEHRWKTYFENTPDKPVIYVGACSCFLGDITMAPPRKYYSVAYFTEYPVSTGSVHITSGNDVHARHDFDTGFLSEKNKKNSSRADNATLRWGYKKAREIARRMSFYRGEYLQGHPKFSPTSEALCKGNQAGPIALDSPKIRYNAEDDRAVEEFNKLYVQTGWHSLGTCAMKPRNKGGVVDPHLNVYGVTNLKVGDLSIAPANVGANTYSTALTIGEKAAVLIAEELGINL
ncbi:alcohol oxidase-like protein [Dendrothele bispora CBS 962.96]|uniref:Alcohol oxidase-like protein n=1 Tax=Dendrothele bispora (strain CBS 962.96) TaxID=1314807 RepID=A0A4V4HE75_DENBC|nr:alcohol oxidase-like protein [Dendrothele bispora CBS 962.96]